MRLLAVHRSPLRFAASFLFSCTSAFALINFDEGHHEFFVTGSGGVTYDSNIFATAGGAGDTSYNASLGIEYRRNVGLIGVDADAAWQFSRFDKFSGENFANPALSAEFTKGTGRTTGALKVSAKRESRAETEINLRTKSWNYDADLQVKYPVIERYSITGGVDYSRRDFPEKNTGLFNIDTYAFNTDLLYALNSQRNLMVGYRYRTTQTTADTTDTDNSLSIGVSGKILPKINGSVRVGFQNRSVQRRVGPDESHNSITSSASATWTVTRRLSVIGTLSRDFITVATDANVDSTSAGLDAQFALNSKTSVFAGLTYNHSDFLDTGLAGRKDDSVNASAGASYSLNDHLKVSGSYSYFVNWSTLPTSDYDRHSFSLSISSHW